MIDKTVSDCRQAVAAITDGSSIMLGGFGNAGMPAQLIEALREHGARNLTIISNGAGTGDYALGVAAADAPPPRSSRIRTTMSRLMRALVSASRSRFSNSLWPPACAHCGNRAAVPVLEAV